jgi:succinate-semialdehyde dehydrogenase / glutarate-semialdehyde dehydrogenase
MTMRSVNPADGSILKEFEPCSPFAIETALQRAAEAAAPWGDLASTERARYLSRAAQVLRSHKEDLARLMSREMGKLIREARAEVEKCAWNCDHYAEHGPRMLADEAVATEAGRSYVRFEPLGTVLAVMPWNFPFWQVFRFAASALVAGNNALLKHASNVPQCALAIEQVFAEAGLPEGVFQNLLIPGADVRRLIEDPRVHAVTVTGSAAAGREIAAVAGAHLKKSVLELGGSDAFILLEDADLDEAATTAVAARFMNAGQSCIAAKRFIPVAAVAEPFLARFKAEVERLVPGDPLDEGSTLAPMARHDLRAALDAQVKASIERGAVPVTGCAPLPGPGAYYAASLLDSVSPGMPAYEEELFGPVASVIRARDEADALRIANDTCFGLGGSVWTRDSVRGERLALRLRCGSSFVNGMVKSDPRLPFGGVKGSGYGRELSQYGLREFVNIKTVWVQ